MSTDLTFFTNQKNSLLDRFSKLLKTTKAFDVLVGYFFSSGFYAMYKNLQDTEKIRILIGISTDRKILNLTQMAKSEQTIIDFSFSDAKAHYSDSVETEMEKIEEDKKIEEGIEKFIEWIKSGKIEIRVYPSSNIHAKLYIMTFFDDNHDNGRVITGSSNFSYSGLVDNLEFNVELKNGADYDFSLEKFNELWSQSVDVSEDYISTINSKTWLNNDITPYEIYLKFLYEYFKEKINIDQEDIFNKYIPEDFMNLEYQEEAVKDAKSKLEQYGGVFISDVVGLGKTYIAAMLAQQLDGRNLIIAPPALLDKYNPGSWPNVFNDFRIPADFESIGKLERLAASNTEKYKNVIIDEAHRFRTESNTTYELLSKICRGKRVILVTATPLNNHPKDILAQIKLFQKSRKSTIPNLPNLEDFFSKLQARVSNLDRLNDNDQYLKIVKSNANSIREKVLKYLMVRRTRNEITNYFGDDLKKQKLSFPEVKDPVSVFYQLNSIEDNVFKQTIEYITKKLKYSRYTPLLYLKESLTHAEELSQKNLGKLMMVLFIKRLESSFYAFRNTLERFIESYKMVIDEFKKGSVYFSKKYLNKIYEYIDNGDYQSIQKLIDDEKAQRFDASQFKPEFIQNLEEDLEILKRIQTLWSSVKRDPKILEFKSMLKNNSLLNEEKIIVFSESRETAEYLADELESIYPAKILLFTGKTSYSMRDELIQNFDANSKNKKNQYRILITTDVLSEGVNLHQSNTVINYDIPWNPTRLIQRVGRVNRVDTKFNEIHSFIFFPTSQANNQIKLKEAAQVKIQYFIEMLGNDARLLAEGEEIKSFDLFNKLSSKNTITGEDDEEVSELKYLKVIRDIRDNQPTLFEKIKRLPKKARSAKKSKKIKGEALLSYFRKGKLQKFFLAEDSSSRELDFFEAADFFEAKANENRIKIGGLFHGFLKQNKSTLESVLSEDSHDFALKGGSDTDSKLLKILNSKEIRYYKGYTDENETFIKKVITLIQDGGLPKQTAKKIFNQINKQIKEGFNPLKVLAILKKEITADFFREILVDTSTEMFGTREVILNEYLEGCSSNE